jgi:hypothetical protein
VEAEGFLTLVICCREFPDDRKRSEFKLYFKRSWYNRLKDMNRHRLYLKRAGIEVDLDQAVHVPEVSERAEFLERMWGRYDEINPLLSDSARRLLLMLLDPTPATSIAYEDFLRKQRLYERGESVTGHKRFRIKLRHIRKALAMSSREMRDAVREVKTLTRGGSE